MKQGTLSVLLLGIALLSGGLIAHAHEVLRVEEMAPPVRPSAPPSVAMAVSAALSASSAIERAPALPALPVSPDDPAATESILGAIVEGCMLLREGRLTARALADTLGTYQPPVVPPKPGEKPPKTFDFKPNNPFLVRAYVVRESTLDGELLDMPDSIVYDLVEPRHLPAPRLQKMLGKAYRPWAFNHEPTPLPMFFEWRKQPKMNTQARCHVTATLGWKLKFGTEEDVVRTLILEVNRGE